MTLARDTRLSMCFSSAWTDCTPSTWRVMSKATPTLPLSREPHRVEDRGKCLVVIIVGGLWSNADEIDQTLLTQNGDKPIRFLASRRRNITEIGREARLSIQTQALRLPRDFHTRI